jgi:hypothetical protein
MADVSVMTTERSRWNFQDFVDSGDGYDPAPDETHFLGGSRNDDADFDLYLLKWEDGSMEAVAARRAGNNRWVVKNESFKEVDDNSIDLLQEVKRRALEQGLVPADDPRDEVADCSDDNRSDIPDDVSGRDHEADAVFLGGSRVEGTVFELYIVPRDPNRRRDGEARAYAISTDSNVSNADWWADGNVPDDDGPGGVAVCEAIRRAIAQGFEFDIDEDALTEKLAASSNSSNPVARPAPRDGNEQKGALAIMETGTKTVTKFKNVTVAESPDEQIHLPHGMTKAAAREWLTQIERNEEQIIQWGETLDAYPLDGALALTKVLANRFGGAVRAGATVPGWWGEIEVPPFMKEIEIGVGQTAHVPWGYFVIPLIPEHKIRVSTTYKEKQLFFRISGEIKRKYQPLLDELVAQVREELKGGSIYKGKAFRLKFPTEQEMAKEDYDPNDFAPKFIAADTQKSELILPADVQEQVDTNVFTPVECTDMVRAQGVPLKRGILLEGKYGVGKTLTASVLAHMCVENGWTFIYLQNIADLEKAMRFARRYEPAVIFAEDIDSVMQQKEGSARDAEMNKILNTIDGVDMKKVEQMVVLTSNFVARINKAMLRPGRLDAVICIAPPDEAAVIRLFRRYAQGLLDHEKDETLMPAAKVLSGQIPSVVREVVERSKLASIRRTKNEGKKQVELKGSDLLVAANGIMAHIKLLEEPEVDERSDIEKGCAVIADALVKSANHGSNGSTGKAVPAAPVSKPKTTTA